MFNLNNKKYFEPFEKVAVMPIQRLWGRILGSVPDIKFPSNLATQYEPQEGDVDFEEYAYVINFKESSFDYYEGSELTRRFKFDNIPAKEEDFKESGVTDEDAKQEDSEEGEEGDDSEEECEEG
jgi:hypothetical protein